MRAHAVAALCARFGTEVPPVLWSPPDPRPTAAPAPSAELDEEESSALRVLAAPRVRIEGRATGAVPARLCLARSGDVTARVIRRGGTATVDLPHCDGSPDRLAALVAPLLGDVPAADPAVAASFPAAEGRAALLAGDSAEIAAQLRRIGVAAEPARLIARGVGGSTRSVEFTVHVGDDRCAGAVAVIDAPSGRIVAHTVPGPGGRAWTAVADGGAHRIGRALRRACEELPGGGWTP